MITERKTHDAPIPPSRHVDVQVRRLALIATVGVALFFLAVAALHVLRPDYHPGLRLLSHYAIGPYGYLMTVAFFALGIGALALTVGLYRARTPMSPVGITLLGVFAVGLLVAGIFPTDLVFLNATRTTAGMIHDWSSLVTFISIIVAMLLLSRRFKTDWRWQPIYPAAMVLALATLVAFFLFMGSFGSGWSGWAQRVFIFLILMWLLLTAIRLRSITMRSISGKI